ncbi:MAG TPA: MFS transporter, partial [Dehalococcoidia bacterium]|nr:MFS transporter [Dehalococcoidia bacterium]
MTTASGTPPAVSPPSPLGRFVTPFAALTEPDYRWIWIGQLSASIGRSMRVFLRGYLVYELTGSAVWLGIVQGSLALPFLFLTFWGGVFADKFDRRRLLITTEIMLVFLWVIVSGLITAGLINEWWLAGGAIVSGTVQSFSRPARMALVPNVVSRQNLPNAVALESMAQSGGTLVGPA